MDNAFDFSPLSDHERGGAAQDLARDVEPHAAKPTCPPADAEPPEVAAARLFGRRPDAIWRYTTAEGKVTFCVCRWNLGDGRKEILCGVEPASLFRSADGGDSWEMVPGISNHEHSRKWQPGAGGLCLHTIVRDGNRMHLGISTGGHYLSEDGGTTFADRKSVV